MIHHRERLPLLFKPAHHLSGVHPGLDNFQRDSSADRLLLLRHPDCAKSALANLLEQLIRTDQAALMFDSRQRLAHHRDVVIVGVFVHRLRRKRKIAPDRLTAIRNVLAPRTPFSRKFISIMARI